MSDQAAARRRLIELKKRQSRVSRPPPNVADRPVRPTYQQEALWFLDTLAGHSEAYNEAVAFRYRGALDVDRLERSLRALITRHESLRTAVLPGDSHPVLATLEPQEAVRRLELSVIHPADGDELSQLQELVALPFDLARAPLFRAYLITDAPAQGVLLLVTHHILFDGWSASVLARDLAAFYECGGDPGGVPALALQFPAYAATQRDEAVLREHERDLAYWTRQLAGLNSLDFPTDRPRPAEQSFAGDTIRFVVNGAVADGLRALARSQGATLFMTLLAAFQAFVARYSQQRDVAVGVPVAGRNAAELEPLVGYFVNTLVMRANVQENPRFVDLLDQVKATVLDGLSHQALPFDQLVAALSPTRTLDRNPLYQVAFALQNHPQPVLALPDCRSESIRVKPKRSKFDLNLTMFDRNGVLKAELEYATDLFDRESADQIARHFHAWLSAIVVEPAERVLNVQFLSAEERHQLIDAWNETKRAYRHDVPVHQLIRERVSKSPDALAVECGDEQLSYAELQRRWTGVARRLQSLGVGPGIVVAVCMERSVDLLVGLLAVLESGAAFLPLDPDHPDERLRRMLSDSGAALVLTQAGLFERIAGWDGVARTAVVVVRAEQADDEPLTTERVVLSEPAHPAYVLYTSGSTGVPKGVVIPHRALSNHEQWFCDVLGLTPADRVLLKSSISNDEVVPECFAALVAGGSVVIAPPGGELDADRQLEDIRQRRVTVVQWGPSEIRALLDQPALRECTTLRYVVSGGEVLSRGLVRAFRQVLPATRLGNFYGPTEATVDSAHCPIDDESLDGASVPIGLPIGNGELHILDDLMQPVPVGVTAQLFVGGAGLALGYLGREDITAECFVPHPFRAGERIYRTGDLARRRRDGLVQFVGRADRQIKIRGCRVEPGEVEAVLRECPGVRDAAVTLREDAAGARVLAGYVETDAEDVSAIRRQLSKRLPELMMPSALVLVSHFPRQPNGKLDYARLPAPGFGRGGHQFVAPRSPAEATLADIWRTVLKCEAVGAHDDFFDLGGHSLSATQVVTRVRAHFGVVLPLRTCFEARTVAEMADAVIARIAPSEPAAEDHISRVPRGVPTPVSFSQRRMWLLQQLEPDGSAYNMKMAVRLNGPLRRDHLLSAIDHIVQRHEAFRTTLRMGGHEPEATVGAVAPGDVAEVDVSDSPREEREAQALLVMRGIAAKPFDLASGPLYRVVLVHLDWQDHALMLVMHHAIADNWSFGVLRRQLESAYNAMVDGRPHGLPEKPIDFVDYASWQRRTYDHESLGPQVSAWVDALRDAPPLALPRDFAVHARVTSRGSVVRAAIPDDLRHRLLSLCARYAVSPYMVMLGAFQWLLSIYCRQTDLCIGTPVANRTKIEAEDVIGSLVNTVVVRTNVDGATTFADVLTRVKAAALFAFTHQDLPFDYLVERLRAITGKAPDIQVLFNVLNSPNEELRLHGIASRYINVDTDTTQFDLAMNVDIDVEKSAELDYSTELFDRRTVENMLGNYFRLLDRVLEAPHAPLAGITLPGPSEFGLLTQWNATRVEVPGPLTIHQRFLRQARQTPAETAIEQPGVGRLTFAELASRVHRLARALRVRGVGRGQLVGLCTERGVPMVVAQLAIMEAGAAYVPLDPIYPAGRLQHMVTDARLSLLVSESTLANAIEWPRERILLLDTDHATVDAELATELGRDVDLDARPSDPAYVIYTSGSTGKPKGVVVPHSAVVNFLSSMAREPGLTAGDRLVAVTTISFDIAVLELLLPLTVGGTVVLPSREQAADGSLLRELLERHAATVMQATPSTWRMLVDAGWSGGSHFKALIGGEALPLDLARQLLDRCGELWNMYGPTETTVWSTCWRVEHVEGGISIGRPIANTQVYVLDSSGQQCPIGVAGEIVIGGEGVTTGYLYREELTSERFESDRFNGVPGARMYRTGDLGRWRHNGTIEHLGRLDFQVKVRGHRIELGEIETALAAHPSVDRVTVIVREDRPGDAKLVAYVVAREPRVAARELRSSLRATLPAYMVPHHFVELAELPLLPNGKIDRNALPPPKEASSLGDETAASTEVPQSVFEVAVAQAFAEVLGVRNVGPADHFFELGGDSLAAVRVAHLVNARFATRVSGAQLLAEPTVAGFARLVEEHVEKSDGSVMQLEEEIALLSDEDVEKLLAEEANGSAAGSGDKQHRGME